MTIHTIHISIHALLAESDSERCRKLNLFIIFLSTLSLRRATLVLDGSKSSIEDFYPRSPCGERHADYSYRNAHPDFYPRSPCGERHEQQQKDARYYKFLSTLSLRRATFYQYRKSGKQGISIHALLAESDFLSISKVWEARYFYPRSPCGERLINNIINGINKIFLSTLSLRRATYHQILLQRSANYFYPRSPCGERQSLWSAY